MYKSELLKQLKLAINKIKKEIGNIDVQRKNICSDVENLNVAINKHKALWQQLNDVREETNESFKQFIVENIELISDEQLQEYSRRFKENDNIFSNGISEVKLQLQQFKEQQTKLQNQLESCIAEVDNSKSTLVLLKEKILQIEWQEQEIQEVKDLQQTQDSVVQLYSLFGKQGKEEQELKDEIYDSMSI